jgi:hypothetical protein
VMTMMIELTKKGINIINMLKAKKKNCS